jgi:hypothetical protein
VLHAREYGIHLLFMFFKHQKLNPATGNSREETARKLNRRIFRWRKSCGSTSLISISGEFERKKPGVFCLISEYSLERLNETYKHARKWHKKHRRSSVLLSFRASQGITGENMR